MRSLATITVALACTVPIAAQESGAARGKTALHVLFVGEVPGAHSVATPERTRAFERFLRDRFEKVTLATHESLTATAVADADVVMLDWHQNTKVRNPTSPLGPRDEWQKPTVLLGSAGLNTAKAWEVFGGSG